MKAMRVHDLKVWPEYFNDLSKNRKPFELRRQDRDYRVGDYLRLTPHEPRMPKTDFGKSAILKVTYILADAPAMGLKPGFCILGLADTDFSEREAIESQIVVQIIKAPKRRVTR